MLGHKMSANKFKRSTSYGEFFKITRELNYKSIPEGSLEIFQICGE